MSVYELLAPRKNWTDLDVNSLTTGSFSADTFTANTINTTTLNTVNLNTSGHTASGTYIPVFSNINGLTNIQNSSALFIRLQNIVFVFGNFIADTVTSIFTIEFSINPPPSATFSTPSALSVSLMGNVTSAQPNFLSFCMIGHIIENPTSLHIAASSVKSQGQYTMAYSGVLFSYSFCFLST